MGHRPHGCPAYGAAPQRCEQRGAERCRPSFAAPRAVQIAVQCWSSIGLPLLVGLRGRVGAERTAGMPPPTPPDPPDPPVGAAPPRGSPHTHPTAPGRRRRCGRGGEVLCWRPPTAAAADVSAPTSRGGEGGVPVGFGVGMMGSPPPQLCSLTASPARPIRSELALLGPTALLTAVVRQLRSPALLHRLLLLLLGPPHSPETPKGPPAPLRALLIRRCGHPCAEVWARLGCCMAQLWGRGADVGSWCHFGVAVQMWGRGADLGS